MRGNRHDSVYLFGAICSGSGVGAAITMPVANTEAMTQHLNEISTQVRRGAHAALICDGAGWQSARQETVSSSQHHTGLAASLFAGTQFDRECLALSPRQQSQRARALPLAAAPKLRDGILIHTSQTQIEAVGS